MSIIAMLMSAAGSGAVSFLAKMAHQGNQYQTSPVCLASAVLGYYHADFGVIAGELFKAVVTKFTPDGSVLWQTKLGFSVASYPRAMVEALDGSKLYVLIEASDAPSGNVGYFIACLNAADGTLLAKSPWLYAETSTAPYSLYIDIDGNIRPCGSITGYRPFFPKLSGATLAIINLDSYNVTSGYGYGIATEMGGNTVVTSMTIWESGGAPGGQKGNLLRLSGTTSSVLTNHVFVSDGGDYYPYSSAIDGANNIFWGGRCNIGTGAYAPILMKIDTAQNVVFSKYITGGSGGCSVEVDGAGNVFVFVEKWMGDVSSCALLKFDGNFNFIGGYKLALTGASATVVNQFGGALSIRGSNLCACWTFVNSVSETAYPIMLVCATEGSFLKPGTYAVGGISILISAISSVPMTALAMTRYSATSGLTTSGSSAVATPVIATAVAAPNLKIM